MSKVKVYVEGEPQSVAEFFLKLYQTSEQKQPEDVNEKKVTKPEVVEPEVVEPEAIDDEFAGAKIYPEPEPTKPEAEPEPKPIDVEAKRAELKVALVEYGVWLNQQGMDAVSVRPYLEAMLRKYGNGVSSTKDLEPEYFEPVMKAAVDRVPAEDLKEFLDASN